MMDTHRLRQVVARFPRAELAHTPTPLEALTRLGARLGGPRLQVKRDDCTGLALGGNKARQLEFYFGDALDQGCDVVLITGAVQSNYMRMAAAAARKLGMQCHLQLEHRVADMPPEYHSSGNVLLYKLLGATLHDYPEGEDEAGADRSLHAIADALRRDGHRPYVIPLGADSPPKGALGYVLAACEVVEQYQAATLTLDAVVVPSGSALTHAGLLVGLRALGLRVPVIGACVRRPASVQQTRVLDRAMTLAAMLGLDGVVAPDDIRIEDFCLGPGYGQVAAETLEAIRLLGSVEGLLLDPVYSAKTFACLIGLVRDRHFDVDANVLTIHTGGTPALFAYHSILDVSDADLRTEI
jgi:D-cysteine desulfhydrase/L-cysteate sulfo-lyase